MAVRDKVSKLIEQGKNILKYNVQSSESGFAYATVSGIEYELWMSEINILNEKYLKKHPLHQYIHSNFFHKTKKVSDCEEMLGYLIAVLQDDEFWGEPLDSNNPITLSVNLEDDINMSNDVFIVHGHDNEAKETVARTLEKLGYNAIILHEQADEGKTIIEKIEKYTNVSYAVVIYTPCDIGRDKVLDESENHYRARQNVVFEHGYLIGKIGRNRVLALVKGTVETPGDISGVVYTAMDDNGAWKMKLCQNMKAAGLDVDMNRIQS